MDVLTSKCLRPSNVAELIEEVMSRINLTSNSRTKLEKMIVDVMTSYLQKIDGVPRSDREAMVIKGKLNAMVADAVCDLISKRYPRKKSRHTQYEAPPLPRQQTQGFANVGSSNFAPAFSDYSFVDSIQPTHTRDSGDVEQRYHEMLNSRKMEMQQHRPTNIDLSLDGSGSRQMMQTPSQDPYDMLLGSGAPQQPQQQYFAPQPQGLGPMFQ